MDGNAAVQTAVLVAVHVQHAVQRVGEELHGGETTVDFAGPLVRGVDEAVQVAFDQVELGLVEDLCLLDQRVHWRTKIKRLITMLFTLKERSADVGSDQ